jgi:ABC-type transport system involved in multi-copper enzyme maturation permease subunit
MSMPRDSALTGLRGSHVRLIGTYWVRFSMRTGGGLLALLFLLIVGLSVASIFLAPVEQVMKMGPEVGHSGTGTAAYIQELAESEQVVDVVQWVFGGAEDQAAYLLREKPALISVILLALLMSYPFVACLAGFNQTAGDISNRGLRYLLIRTERPNIFFGRFLGAVGFTAVSMALVFVILVLYVYFKLGVYGFGETVLWSVQGYFACLATMVPFLALCAWVSCLIDSAFGALAISLLLVGFPVAILKVAGYAIPPGDHAWLERLTPWGWKYDLLSVDLGMRMLAFLVMGGFTALFLMLGMRRFARRDL